jgi:hypothetical protein
MMMPTVRRSRRRTRAPGSTLKLRRWTAPALALLLLAGVGAGIWRSNALLRDQRAPSAQLAPEIELLAVRGLIGSEKEAYFADPRVQAALHAQGLEVTVSKAGSRDIARRYDAAQLDFGFPSGAPSAAQLRKLANAENTYSPFYTPLVIASFRPIAEILVANGIAKREGELYYIVDLPRLLSLIEQGTRWNQLRASEAFQTGKSVLINSTDVRSSNSAAMYLALASYVWNDQQVVQSQGDVERVMPHVAPLFLRQGFQETSSAAPFEDYLALGMGKAPLLVAYESQLIETWLAYPARLKSEMVLLYPRPTVFSKHVLVPFTPAGDRLGALLERDPQLRRLAHEHGFRTGGEQRGPELWATKGIQAPENLLDVLDPPSYEWLERMIEDIEARFK